jgi:hypothetical protein
VYKYDELWVSGPSWTLRLLTDNAGPSLSGLAIIPRTPDHTSQSVFCALDDGTLLDYYLDGTDWKQGQILSSSLRRLR